MPRRKRESKRRDELTLERDLLLTLGPRPRQPLPKPGDDEWEALRACWFAHRDRLVGNGTPEQTWGYWVFELGEAPVEFELEKVHGGNDDG